nr:putative CYP719 [synthetic construct]
MDQTNILLAVAAALFIGLLTKLLASNSKHHLPPGPKPLPIIGNMLELSKGGELLHVSLAKLAERYGEIMSFWFGGFEPSIVVTSHELVWEVMVTKANDFSDRALPWLTKILTSNWQTLATCDLGPYWYSIRKGLQSTTLNHQTIMSQTQLQERDIADLLTSLEQEASSNNGIVKPYPMLRKLMVRLVSRFCFGPDFPNDEEFVERMDSTLDESIHQSGHTRLADLFEFTRYVPGLWGPFKESESLKRRIVNLLTPHLKAASSPNCYSSLLLSKGLSEEVVVLNLYELFELAVDATSNTTAWALAFIIHNKDAQEKVFKEVRYNQVGERRKIIRVEELGEMEYVQAVAKETIRMRPIAPVMPHKAARDGELKGVKVRGGTPVLMNFYAVLHDEKVWREPYKFTPERFTTKGVDAEAMERSYVSFGVGRRSCPGMELAKIQIAVTVANLVNRFEWCSAAEGELPDLSEGLTFVLMMKTPLVARIVPRSY